MDGGIGETMLISSAIGAAGGAYGAHRNGTNPWQGALMGGALGAAGGGAGAYLGGAADAADTTGSVIGANSGDMSSLSSLPSSDPMMQQAMASQASPGLTSAGATPTAAPSVAPTGASPALSSAGLQPQGALGQGVQGQGIGSNLLQGSQGSTLGLNPMNSALAAPDNPLSQSQLSALNQATPTTGMPKPTFSMDPLGWAENNKGVLGLGAMGIASMLSNRKYGVPSQAPYSGALSKYHFTPSTNSSFTQAPTFSMASGGLPSLAKGEARGETLRGTMGQLHGVEHLTTYANGGGISTLGGYAHGGNPRLLTGPGDGMSDSIPASIDNKQPARLASGEFVVPADVVSHLGNGSTDAGAKQLQDMMSRVRKARTGNSKQGKQINPTKLLPS